MLLQVEPKVQKLYDYIKDRGTILSIHEYSKELLSKDDVHKRVAESIRSGMSWGDAACTALFECTSGLVVVLLGRIGYTACSVEPHAIL